MKNTGTMQIKWSTKRTIIFLCILFVLKILINLALYENGFLSVSADEFARGIRAAEWSQNPLINILSDIKDTWLPFEKYLNGSILRIWPDVIWAPRLTVFFTSCLVSIILFFLFETLFENSLLAALSIIFLVFQPWYAWLSATPMLEMYYFSFFFLGIYLFVLWAKNGKRGYWFLAGFCFMFASGFHVQSWVYLNLFNLVTVGYMINKIKQKEFLNISSLVAFYILGNLLIIVFTVIEFIGTGQIFGFLSAHTDYSKWFYGGYEASILKKALYYPRLFLENASEVVWFLFATSILFVINDRNKKWKLLPLIFSSIGLPIMSLLNIISVPATAAPGRYSLMFIIFLSPYFTYGLIRMFYLNFSKLKKTNLYLFSALLAVLFLYSIFWGIEKLYDFPRVISWDAVEAGNSINEKLNQYSPNRVPNYMVELTYWDFLGVKTAGGFYEQIIFDREYDIKNRNTESIFLDEFKDPYLVLLSQNVKFIALQNDILKNLANETEYLLIRDEIGRWTIYEFILEKKSENLYLNNN